MPAWYRMTRNEGGAPVESTLRLEEYQDRDRWEVKPAGYTQERPSRFCSASIAACSAKYAAARRLESIVTQP